MSKINTLAASAVLCDLCISSWNAKKKDRTLEAELQESKNAASSRATSVQKNLFADCPELDAIVAYGAKVRLWFNSVTAPWDDKGKRIVPSVSYMEIAARFSEHQDAFNQLVNKFVSVYDTAISKQAFTRGEMFDRSEYPTKAEIRGKFGMRIDVCPVPQTGHFLPALVDSIGEDLRESFEASANARVEEAVKEVWQRLADKVEHIRDRMSAVLEFDPNAEPEIVQGEDGEASIKKPRRPKLHQSLLDSAMELCDTMRTLNIMNDPAMEQARVDLLNAVKHLDIDSLKKSPEMQKSTKQKMEELRARLPW